MTNPATTAKPGDLLQSATGDRWFLAADPRRDSDPWVQTTSASSYGYRWRTQGQAEAAGLMPLPPAADVVDAEVHEDCCGEHGTPAGLRWAADEVQKIAWSDTASRSAVDLRREADRLDRKAEEAERDQKDREVAEKIADEHDDFCDATSPGHAKFVAAVLAGIRAGREEANR
jgi:hypothetical protein